MEENVVKTRRTTVETRRRTMVRGTAAAVAALTAVTLSTWAPATALASAKVSGASSIPIGIDLTYNDTPFWAAYIQYEATYAKQMNIKLIGPLLAAANASLQNQQIEELVNEGAKAVVVNPETATSLGPAIDYATKHNVKLVSVDTIVGTGHVYMVVRASNVLYGQDSCAYISSKVKSGYVLDLEGDLTSSNGADRTNAFDSCMAANDPGVKILKDPTVWTEATAVTDAEDAINAYGKNLKAIYVQWDSPDYGIISYLASKGFGPAGGSADHVIMVSDDGVPAEMCEISRGWLDASQSQPANLYAQYALTYAVDAAKGMTLTPGMAGGGAPSLQYVSYLGDKNLGDPIVAPFVTKSTMTLTVAHAVDGLPASTTSTPVTSGSLYGNVLGKAQGGDCKGVTAYK
jgi:ribose transport system substrate-binding protein